MASKPLRPQQGVEQIDKQKHRRDACNPEIHNGSSEFLAELYESPANPEKDSRNGDKEKIKHGCSPSSRKQPPPRGPSGAGAAPVFPHESATSA
jgi:hypothetical protein